MLRKCWEKKGKPKAGGAEENPGQHRGGFGGGLAQLRNAEGGIVRGNSKGVDNEKSWEGGGVRGARGEILWKFIKTKQSGSRGYNKSYQTFQSRPRSDRFRGELCRGQSITENRVERREEQTQGWILETSRAKRGRTERGGGNKN